MSPAQRFHAVIFAAGEAEGERRRKLLMDEADILIILYWTILGACNGDR